MKTIFSHRQSDGISVGMTIVPKNGRKFAVMAITSVNKKLYQFSKAVARNVLIGRLQKEIGIWLNNDLQFQDMIEMGTPYWAQNESLGICWDSDGEKPTCVIMPIPDNVDQLDIIKAFRLRFKPEAYASVKLFENPIFSTSRKIAYSNIIEMFEDAVSSLAESQRYIKV